MSSKVSVKFGLFSGLLFTLLICISYVDGGENNAAANNLPQVVQGVDFNRGFDWAGEAMPLSQDAKERLDRELSVNAYWHSSSLLNMKLANKYFPTIERILLEHGVPDDFKYLAVAESGLRNATSSASAKGYWQFMKLSAKEFNLEVNDQVDERYHLEKSTRAAAQYLKRLHDRFGSWTSAAAAYNVGPTKYSRVMKEQKSNSYYDLNLNSETARYVFRLIALKELMSRPNDFGYYLNYEDKYPPLDNFYEVKVDKTVPSWADFAEEHGISYRTLKYYNPWLIDSDLTVIKNTYNIKIPK